MFGQVARRYDLLNRVLSLGLDSGWRRRAVEELAPRDRGRYLDVGCGSGDMMLEIAARVPGVGLCGIDPVAGMLELAREKVARAGSTVRTPGFQVADAADLPFAAGTFDGITCAFCIRNVEHRLSVFREMYRVLRRADGCRAVILELTEPSGTVLRLLHRCYGLLWVPLVGAVLSRGRAYRYLVRSIRHFPRPQLLQQEMVEAGFAQTRATPLNGGIVTLFSGSTVPGSPSR